MQTLKLSISVLAGRALKIPNKVSIWALKLSNFTRFRILKISNMLYDFRALKSPIGWVLGQRNLYEDEETQNNDLRLLVVEVEFWWGGGVVHKPIFMSKPTRLS